jgi:hypothetical protein
VPSHDDKPYQGKYAVDNRPDALSWQKEFGKEHWKSPRVDDEMAKTSLITLQNAMKGRKIGETQRKAAEFVAAHKAWPMIRGESVVNINVLRLEDIQAAKIKAGLMPKAFIDAPKEKEEVLTPSLPRDRA